MTRVSVIIPTRDEADNLPATVESLRLGEIEEIIVVDGASRDGTVVVARDLGCRVLEVEEPGRARQMNLGAAEARGDVFLFLHADTIVEETSLRALAEAMDREPDIAGGGYAREFSGDSVFLRVTCRWASWRGRKYGIFLGDQGIFVRKEIFDRLGGFDEDFGPGEDIDFSLRLRGTGRTVMLEPRVISSDRRFRERGVVFQTVIDFLHARKLLAKAAAKTRP